VIVGRACGPSRADSARQVACPGRRRPPSQSSPVDAGYLGSGFRDDSLQTRFRYPDVLAELGAVEQRYRRCWKCPRRASRSPRWPASTGGAADGARSLRRYAEDGLGGLVGPAFGRRSASIRCPRWWRRRSWRCGWRWASCPRGRAQAAPTGGLPAVGRLRATGLVADGQDGPVFLAGGAEVKVARTGSMTIPVRRCAIAVPRATAVLSPRRYEPGQLATSRRPIHGS
jgi:hypothetical protein